MPPIFPLDRAPRDGSDNAAPFCFDGKECRAECRAAADADYFEMLLLLCHDAHDGAAITFVVYVAARRHAADSHEFARDSARYDFHARRTDITRRRYADAHTIRAAQAVCAFF